MSERQCDTCKFGKKIFENSNEYECSFSNHGIVPFAHVKHTVSIRDGYMTVEFDDCGWPDVGSSFCDCWKEE